MEKIDLRKLTTKEFSEMFNVDIDTIRELMRNCSHMGYTNNPYYHTVIAVQNSTIKDGNKEVVAKFIYTNLFNRPDHRFYDKKGYSPDLYSTPCGIF